MLDDGNGLVRRKPVRRTPAERSAIVAETYRPGATVADYAHRCFHIKGDLNQAYLVVQELCSSSV